MRLARQWVPNQEEPSTDISRTYLFPVLSPIFSGGQLWDFTQSILFLWDARNMRSKRLEGKFLEQ